MTTCRMKIIMRTLVRRFFLLILMICILPLTSFVAKFKPLTLRKIVIDAGHGGHDPGCLGTGSREKDIALAVSLKLGKYIEENMKDVQVIYTRKTDKFIELHERANIANKQDADLFICIHCNANDNKAAFGSETYVLGLHRAKENLTVAKRENAAILMEDDYKKNYDGFDPNSDEAHIIFSLYQSAFLNQSLDFAAKVQEQFKVKAKRYDRGVKQAGLLVLARTTMPGVLIETGFLTNKDEEAFLKDEKGQDNMAASIYHAVEEYKKGIEGGPGMKESKPKEPVINDLNKNEVKDVNTLVKDKPDEIKKEETKRTEKKAGPIKIEEVIKPEVKEKETGIKFKVQVKSSTRPIEIKPENFKGLNNITEYETGGIYRYTFGNEESVTAANELQKVAREKGFTDAFVVAFKNGERISTNEALKELNK